MPAPSRTAIDRHRWHLKVDGRLENAAFLKKHLTRNFRFEYRVLFDNTVVTLVS